MTTDTDAAMKARDIAGELWEAAIRCDFDAFKIEVANAFSTTSSAQEEAVRVTEGYALAPLEPTPAMLDVAVSYALNVSISSRYNWSAYMRDVWVRMIAASGDKPLQVSGYVTLDEAFMSAAAPAASAGDQEVGS